jgi:hypothetical protein
MATLYDEQGNPVETSQSFWDQFGAVISGALNVYQQKMLIDINAERAKIGQAPISASAFAPTVNVGLPPEQLQALMMLGMGLIAVLYLRGGK